MFLKNLTRNYQQFKIEKMVTESLRKDHDLIEKTRKDFENLAEQIIQKISEQ